MTPLRRVALYPLAAAVMAALGAATAAAIVALEERTSRRLGDAEASADPVDGGGSLTLTAFDGDGFQRLLDRVQQCDPGCTCHGRYGERS